MFVHSKDTYVSLKSNKAGDMHEACNSAGLCIPPENEEIN